LSHFILLLFQGFIISRRKVALDRRLAKRFLSVELCKQLTVLVGLVAKYKQCCRWGLVCGRRLIVNFVTSSVIVYQPSR